jgi:hypothetical protein
MYLIKYSSIALHIPSWYTPRNFFFINSQAGGLFSDTGIIELLAKNATFGRQFFKSTVKFLFIQQCLQGLFLFLNLTVP